MSNQSQTKDPSAPSNVQQVSIPFSSRSISGKINIALYPNTDSQHACGLDLIFPSTPFSNFHGFPVMKASIEYAGPSSPFSSYTQLFGWIQFVKAIPMNADGSSEETGEWEMDIYPFAKDLKMPFCFWGHNPTAFDAPCRLLKEDGTVEELVWRAQSFLCVLEDAGMTKKIKVVEGAAFGWGFDMKAAKGSGSGVERKIVIKEVEVLDQDKEWANRLVLLRREYPDWTFGGEAHR